MRFRPHLALGLRNVREQEIARGFYYNWYGELVDDLPPVENGMISVPKKPGLGMDLQPGLFTREDAIPPDIQAGLSRKKTGRIIRSGPLEKSLLGKLVVDTLDVPVHAENSAIIQPYAVFGRNRAVLLGDRTRETVPSHP